MLTALQKRPDDVALRRQAAEALDAAGQFDEAATVLAPLVNVSGHESDTGLPCLCKACLPFAGRTAESGGMQFSRSFAIAQTRVLHFWQLADQARAAVRVSVTEALDRRLAKSAWHK
jgi:hypothetical protein